MTKENFTAIAVIADASSSMTGLTNETIANFNKFLNEQKAIPGEAAFSLCTFNTDYRLVHDFIPLQSVEELTNKTYRCSGCTALLDAMGTTIDSLGSKLAAMPEQDRPSKVVVLVITDGEENSSQRYTLEQIKDKVTHQREVYSWEFVFIGANIDAITAGTSMGFTAQNSVAYVASAAGTNQLYRSISSNMSSMRRGLTASNGDFFAQTGVTPTTGVQGSAQGSINIAPVVPATPQTNIGSTTAGDFDPGHALPTNNNK